MAVQHVCDRCGKVIRDFETDKHIVLVFDKNIEPNMIISRCGVGYMNKAKYADLCENCQDDLHTVMEAFMNSNTINDTTQKNVIIF